MEMRRITLAPLGILVREIYHKMPRMHLALLWIHLLYSVDFLPWGVVYLKDPMVYYY
jgi:hypothetical protein